jgi:hypothetical protein
MPSSPPIISAEARAIDLMFLEAFIIHLPSLVRASSWLIASVMGIFGALWRVIIIETSTGHRGNIFLRAVPPKLVVDRGDKELE